MCILSNNETHNILDVDAVGGLGYLFGFLIGGHVLVEAARDEVRAGRGLDAGWFDVLAWRTWVGLDAAQLGFGHGIQRCIPRWIANRSMSDPRCIDVGAG